MFKLKNIFKIASLALFTLCFATLVNTQTLTDELKFNINDQHLTLWQVSKNSKTAYILGSIHLLREEDYPLDSRIDQVVDQSTTFVFEADTETNKQELLIKTLELGSYKEDKEIKDELRPETFKSLQKSLAEIGQKDSYCNKLRPWLCSIMISLYIDSRNGFKSDIGVEEYILKRAKDKKEIEKLYLESAVSQLETMANTDELFQENMILSTLQDIPQYKDIIVSLVEAWKKGDTNAIEENALSTLKDFPQIGEALIYKRNRAWIPKIEKIIEEKNNVLIVVGAGHLVGENSVIDLLNKEGYTTQQI